MDLILKLEEKFNKINNKQDSNSKVELINNNHNNYIEAINRVFDSTKERVRKILFIMNQLITESKTQNKNIFLFKF